MRTTNLPDVTAENFLDMIRAANQRDSNKKGNGNSSEGPRKSVDIYCDACGAHGHRWRDCDFLAKLIKCLTFVNSMDAAKKKALLESFHKEQERKRAGKQNKAKIRALQYLEDKDINGMYALVQELHTAQDAKDYMEFSKILDEQQQE
jgi:hypothetical protein